MYIRDMLWWINMVYNTNKHALLAPFHLKIVKEETFLSPKIEFSYPLPPPINITCPIVKVLIVNMPHTTDFYQHTTPLLHNYCLELKYIFKGKWM